MKVTVDYDVCASTGGCMQICPEVFEVRSDGYLYLLIEGEIRRDLHGQGQRSRRPLPDGRDHARRTDGSGDGDVGFYDQLDRAWSASRSLLCVGLDPDPTQFPPRSIAGHDAVFRFCKEIVDATADLVCAFKPQIAYFASQREEPALEQLCAYIRDTYPDVTLIVDAKRGDIGSTAEHYAREVFGRYNAHAVTVNPYLGRDSVARSSPTAAA